jgi:hypothetical protein
MEDTLTSEFCSLTLNALAGTNEWEALKLRALYKNKVMLILVDSGSTHNFVSTTFLQKIGLQAQSGKPQVVRVANGETLITDAMVPQMEWWC